MPKSPEFSSSEDELKQEGEENQEQELTETEKKVSALAGQLHDEWRKPRWKEESQNYEPRVKKTKDETWSKSHGGAIEVDIANTSYEDLPSDWQTENKSSAEVAIGTIIDADVFGKKFDERFLEGASSVLHDKWLERNGSYAPPEQNKPYAELSEDEKEKDRVIIRKALEVYTKGEPRENLQNDNELIPKFNSQEEFDSWYDSLSPEEKKELNAKSRQRLENARGAIEKEYSGHAFDDTEWDQSLEIGAKKRKKEMGGK